MPGKALTFAEAGRRGARKRWGEPRHVKLNELQPAIRAAVVALIEADLQARAAAEAAEPPGSGQS